jgi:hypothetical protein
VVSLEDVTATGNAAKGGAGYSAGSGLGAALFNLNGNVTIDFSTFGGNFVAGNNGAATAQGPEDAAIYSLAYGNKIQDGSASSASLTIHNSIVHGTHSDGGDGDDIIVNVVNGAHANSSGVYYDSRNFVGRSSTVLGVTQNGTSPNTGDPLLGAFERLRRISDSTAGASARSEQSGAVRGGQLHRGRRLVAADQRRTRRRAALPGHVLARRVSIRRRLHLCREQRHRAVSRLLRIRGTSLRPFCRLRMSLIAELRRRNVIHTAGLFRVGERLITHVSSTVLPMFGASERAAALDRDPDLPGSFRPS